MAKIVIAGDALVVTSGMKLEDLRMVKKYRPKALTLMGGENNKEVLYTIMLGDGNGSINEVGATFGKTATADGLACITTILEARPGNVAEFVADAYGADVALLSKLEATLPAVLEEIKAAREEIIANIEVVG